jgi:hypothetical protein
LYLTKVKEGVSKVTPSFLIDMFISFAPPKEMNQRKRVRKRQPHMESLKETLGRMPDTIVADAGYGSEENYEYLEKNNVEAFVKYQYFHKEQSEKWKTDPYRLENLPYDEKDDTFTCPANQKMNLIEEKVKITDNGFRQVKRFYQAENCKGCPMREACNKSKWNRRIEVNPSLNYYKSIVKERLFSEY